MYLCSYVALAVAVLLLLLLLLPLKSAPETGVPNSLSYMSRNACSLSSASDSFCSAADTQSLGLLACLSAAMAAACLGS